MMHWSSLERARMRGSSFVEVMFALAIVGVATMVQIQQVTITLREHNVDVETQFAFRKASGMLAELQAHVDQGAIGSTTALDAIANGEASPFLTTRSVVAPDHVMSGNVTHADGTWRWFRDIDVDPMEGSDRSRYVRIKVLRADPSGHRTVAAVASGVLSVTVRAEPFVQTYDVYALAIAEAPSLWQTLPALRAQLQSIASEIGGANPNLRFRLHWISKLGYGRDPSYVPYVNETTPADAAAPWAYWYPGKLAAGACASTLYSAEMISGRVRTEAGVLHDFDAEDNPYPYAVADRFNHCMRTPEARALFQLRVDAGLEKADEPPLQLLLADMAERPEAFKNAIVVNLHGDGLPFPPVRNYSDAAKDPEGRPGVRVVTHPVRLHNRRGSQGTVDAARELGATLLAVAQSRVTGYEEVSDAASHVSDAISALLQTPARADLAQTHLEEAQESLDEADDEGCAEAYEYNLRVRDMVADCQARSNAMAAPELKVYAYKSDPASGPVVLAEPITLQIMGVDLTRNVNSVLSNVATTLEIRRIEGGIDQATGRVTSRLETYDHFYESAGVPPRPGASAQPYEMRYEVGYATTPAPHTWIRLYNTPLVAPFDGDEGLPATERLYGVEYIPSPVGKVVRDLDQDGAQPKNTARWRIRIPASALPAQDTMLTVHTRIGSDVTTGRMVPTAHQPHNLSTTYTWWTDSVEDVPLIERYQFLGDPRHNPYEDLSANGASFPHGYNWWFDDLRNAGTDVGAVWSCLDRNRLRDGFGRGVVEDVPRIMQTWRDALQACRAVFVNPQGLLAGSVLFGGEIALPDGPVALHAAFYGRTGTLALDDIDAPSGLDNAWLSIAAPSGESDEDEDEGMAAVGVVIPSGVSLGGHPVLTAGAGFFAKPWLGELVPDAAFAAYRADGNLATATGCVRASRSVIASAALPRGSSWAFPSGTTLDDLGGASLLQSGGSSASFVQGTAQVGAASLLSELHAFTDAIGIATPGAGSASLTFRLQGTPSSTLEQRKYTDLFPDHETTLLETFAAGTATDNVAAGVIRLAASGSNGGAAFFVPSGDLPACDDGHRAAVFKSLALGLRALLVASEPSRNDGVLPLPLASISMPQPKQVLNRVDTVELRWGTEFRRFDGQPYTPRFDTGWQGVESDLIYLVSYRRASEPQWLHAFDGVPLELGVWPQDPTRRLYDSGTGKESYFVALPADRFPAGEYVLRVDCFRCGGVLHASQHEVVIEVKR